MKVFLEQLALIATYAGIVQGLFFALLLNNRGVRKSRANFFLSILLIAFSFSTAHILFAEAVINHLSAQIYSIGDPTFYLIAPLLWFYTNELTGYTVKWAWKLLLHFLPFFLIILFSTSFRSFNPAGFIGFLGEYNRLFTILFWITLVIQFSWYQILVRKRLVAYRKFVTEEASFKEGVDIAWIRFFMIVFLVINLFFLFSLFAAIHLDNGLWLPKITALIFSLSVFALGYKGILQKDLFQKSASPGENRIEPPVATAVVKPEPEHINRLLNHMANKRPFLDSELTLTALAKDLNVSRSQLSFLINEGIGDNFYDFINKYRVEEVKKLMADPQVKNYNLLGIALEAGFKSKSTFNLIFKRFTGLTPTEFRKNLSE